MDAKDLIAFFVGLQEVTLDIVDKAVAAAAVPREPLADAKLAMTS